MDLNHIFLFLALATPLLVLAKAWRPGGIFRGWRIAAIIVLAITGVAWLFFRDYAGYIGGGAWFALLFLPMAGLRRASELAAQGRYKSAARIARALKVLHPTSQLREQVEIFERLESRQGPDVKIDVQPLPDAIFHRLRTAPAVFVIIFLNIAVFALELWRGALDNPIALRRLGALDFNEVINDGEFWRLFTALFLHGSFPHIVFNLIALYVIGPPLERIIGGIPFIGFYLITGIGSTAGVLLLTVVKVASPGDLVGASGCIMGIVGIWAGYLLRHRHIWQARQRLLNILFIIVIQVVFDVLTPQVSTSAHVCGMITGFVIGLVMTPKRTSF